MKDSEPMSSDPNPIQKEASMVLSDSTRVGYCGMAAIVAVVIFAALALASAMPAWAQAPPSPSPAEACTPGLIVDFCRLIPLAE